MSERGVFAVDRGIWSDPDFADEPFSEREAFLWLISEAAWRARAIRIKGATVSLARGQCAFSLRFMAQKWAWSEASVRRFLNRLKRCGIIDAVSDAHATTITICKYDRFQRVGLPGDAVPDGNVTQLRRDGDAKTKQGNIETEIIPSSVPSEGIPTPDAPAKPATDRGRALPDDWAPHANHYAKASKQGFSPQWVDDLAEVMRDWAKANAGKAITRKSDWDSTFNGFIHREIKESRRNSHASVLQFPRAPPRQQSRIDEIRDPIFKAGMQKLFGEAQ